jgi:hypothetical protein
MRTPTMRTASLRGIFTAALAIGCALAVAACGSSSKPTKKSGPPAHTQGLEFANCMRTHGVAKFPDPSGGGGGINLDGTGVNPRSPAFVSAQQACVKFAPGGRGTPTATESQYRSALTFAKCMRTHGISNFPDPTRADSPPGPILVIGPGLYFRVSVNFDPDAPAAKSAIGACGGR